jgi:hypothetical protein
MEFTTERPDYRPFFLLGKDQGFVEALAIKVPCLPLSENQGLEVQIGHDMINGTLQ